VQRGASSALLSRHGLESEKSGDEDFDGLFHHQGVIKPGQRGLLLDLWQLLPDFGISQGHLSGQVVYEQSPQGLARLSQIVEKLHSFQKEFPAATTHPRSLPVGFVRNQKLSQESTFCWLGATIAGTPALGYASYCGVAGLSIYDLGTLACLLLLATALSFVNCALQVTRGSYAAVQALEWTRKLTLCAGLVVVPLVVRSAASPIGASVVGVMMVVMAHLSLSQLKDKWEGILDRS